MKFTKMHGLGNDYIYVNGFEEHVDDPPALARAVSDRHTGIGSDGLILIRPSDKADIRMEMYNTDGSRARMCGNGIRCVAKYAVEHGLTTGLNVLIETDAGVKVAECHIVDGVVQSVRVDMGRPSLAPSAIPSTISADRIVNHPLRIALPEPRALTRAEPQTETEPRASARAELRTEYAVTCVSMGNPHAVVFVDDVDAIALDVIGPQFEHAPQFPERINAHFVRVDSPEHVTMKTWERGSGITRACGTGACAVCVAGAVTGRTRRTIIATLPGGDLELEWADNDHVYMTGPAVEIFTGDWHE
ncbi:MAG: diaminopimelate epimerase [Phycisphaerae bacterium]